MLSMRNMTVGVQGLGCKHVEHEEHDCWAAHAQNVSHRADADTSTMHGDLRDWGQRDEC